MLELVFVAVVAAAPKACGADADCLQSAAADCAPAVLRMERPKLEFRGVSAAYAGIIEVVAPAGPHSCKVLLRTEVSDLEVSERYTLPDGGHPKSETERRAAAAEYAADFSESPASLSSCQMARDKIGSFARGVLGGSYDLMSFAGCRSPKCWRWKLAEGCVHGACRDGVQELTCRRFGETRRCSYDSSSFVGPLVDEEVLCTTEGEARALKAGGPGPKQIIVKAAALGNDVRAFEGWAADGSAVVWRLVDVSRPKGQPPFRVTRLEVATGDELGKQYTVELAGPEAGLLDELSRTSMGQPLAEYEAWLKEHPLVTVSEAGGAERVRLVATSRKKGRQVEVTRSGDVFRVKSAAGVTIEVLVDGQPRDDLPGTQGKTDMTVQVVIAPGGKAAAVVVSDPSLPGRAIKRYVKL